MSEWVPWLPLLVTLITVIGGLLAYGMQRKIDRRETLRNERRKLYLELIQIIRNTEAEALNKEWKQALVYYKMWTAFETSLLVFAPDHVALQLRETRKRYLSYEKSFKQIGYSHELYLAFATQLYRMIFEMRKDTLELSHLPLAYNAEEFVEDMKDANL